MSGAGWSSPWDGRRPACRGWPPAGPPIGAPPLADVILVVAERGGALGLADVELAGILGIGERDWRAFLRRWPHVGTEDRLERSIRTLCDLLGAVLAFAGPADGACWMRAHHPAMGDSPLGRLIRSPDALLWLRNVLIAEGRG